MTKLDEGLLDKILEGVDPSNPQSLFTEAGLFGQLKKALAERMLQAELDHHLAQERNAGEIKNNYKNGSSKKTVLASQDKIELNIPRDREGNFDPQLIAKHQRRLPGFDDKVISLYARGLPVREIQGHLTELYGLEVSPDLISKVTSSVMDEVTEWQNRPLESVYPLVFFDALRVKIRDEGSVKNKAVYLALGVRSDGLKEILGIWVEQTEGAKFWLRVMTELKNRGVTDILIAVIDGLKGFPEAITAAFPQTQIQTCIVHLIRNSLEFVSWKDRKAVAAELKTIYRATTEEEAAQALEAFANGPWGLKYPPIASIWQRHWQEVIPFFAYPLEVRKIIYTTNAIESLHMRVRKVIKNRGHFPNDQAAIKLIYLALRNISKEWKMPPIIWRAAKIQFAILFGDRFTVSLA
ncbi:Transposase, mutator type [Mycoavidus cysteinexigens]|uniref:Mutator family transposase n=1 Tax=Mycoavidus cysteinexigens TaxID=1553431 RepID=A0A2Z6EVD7_9BURK|nr:IS256 family transposase [Mycoavidus cysteinexigens]BBE08806.1 Transposase, mutator type [Mycoavidus cysteinexigens]BBE09236.1 Transposase, mutator type [Mycoavidus cysteinexigens]BBE09391.1 Transposase, mutator type [Mycoavidus cysteinexigens]